MKLSNNKGTIITGTIMMLGLISLIAVPNLSGIRQRSQVSADIRTAEQIGKATRIWAVDVDTEGGRELPTEAVRYDEINELDDYISPDYTANSYRYGTGYYYVSGDGQKIRVAIAGNKEEANNLTDWDNNYNGYAAWAYVEK